MKPRITVVTIGVDDLEKSLRFYRDGLGLQTQGIIGTEFEYGAVAFFDLQAGLKLAIWPRKSISQDSGTPVGPSSPTEFTLGHNVSSKEEVDAVMQQARKAGAVVVKDAHDTFWGGYAGYFQDPNGHLWEVAWNPAWGKSGNREDVHPIHPISLRKEHTPQRDRPQGRRSQSRESSSIHAHATTAVPGLQPGGSVQSQPAASRAVLSSPALISMLQTKIRWLLQLMAPFPKATWSGPPSPGWRSSASRVRT